MIVPAQLCNLFVHNGYINTIRYALLIRSFTTSRDWNTFVPRFEGIVNTLCVSFG